MPDGELTQSEWAHIQSVIPIACVDVVPLRRVGDGTVEVGLILRTTPFDGEPELWCHLGGRIRYGETLDEALARHVRETVSGAVRLPAPGSRPHAVSQFFPDARPGDYGVDPRKQAISSCFAVWVDGEAAVIPGGEGSELKRYPPGEIDTLSLWPGTSSLVRRVLVAVEAGDERAQENLRAAYASISDEGLNHNALVWQTPALALTAQAFLLTIALGSDSSTLARLIASGLNVMLSVLCLQLMAKHQAMNIVNREDLMSIERRLGLPPFHQRAPAGALQGLAVYRSGLWWKRGFMLLIAASSTIFVIAVLQSVTDINIL